MIDQEQHDNLERVRARIGRAVIQFCRTHRFFHADELRNAVAAEAGASAPGSADRVLRDLRQRGVIRYVVLCRRDSYYEVRAVNGSQPSQ